MESFALAKEGVLGLTAGRCFPTDPGLRFDAARCFALTVYGAIWNGPINVVLYRSYVRMFGTGTVVAVVLSVAADQLIWMPLLAIPMAYLFTDTIKDTLNGR